MITKYSKKFKIVTPDGKILDTFRTHHCAVRMLPKLRMHRSEELKVERK